MKKTFHRIKVMKNYKNQEGVILLFKTKIESTSKSVHFVAHKETCTIYDNVSMKVTKIEKPFLK